jgi:hypothetical protein
VLVCAVLGLFHYRLLPAAQGALGHQSIKQTHVCHWAICAWKCGGSQMGTHARDATGQAECDRHCLVLQLEIAKKDLLSFGWGKNRSTVEALLRQLFVAVVICVAVLCFEEAACLACGLMKHPSTWSICSLPTCECDACCVPGISSNYTASYCYRSVLELSIASKQLCCA